LCGSGAAAGGGASDWKEVPEWERNLSRAERQQDALFHYAGLMTTAPARRGCVTMADGTTGVALRRFRSSPLAT